MQLSAVIRKEGQLYSAWCAELDVASQGPTEDEALANLREAVLLYLEDADAKVPKHRAKLTTFEVDHGSPSSPLRA